jgi:hypothetical protein
MSQREPGVNETLATALSVQLLGTYILLTCVYICQPLQAAKLQYINTLSLPFELYSTSILHLF